MIDNPLRVTKPPHRLIKVHIGPLILFLNVVQQSSLITVTELVRTEGSEVGDELYGVYLEKEGLSARDQHVQGFSARNSTCSVRNSTCSVQNSTWKSVHACESAMAAPAHAEFQAICSAICRTDRYVAFISSMFGRPDKGCRYKTLNPDLWYNSRLL